MTQSSGADRPRDRPFHVTSVVPELQRAPILEMLRRGLASHIAPPGTRWYLIAGDDFIEEFIGQPRAERTISLLRVHTTPVLGFQHLGTQVLFWGYGVPMAIAVVIATAGGAMPSLFAAPAALPGALTIESAGTAAAATLPDATLLARLATAVAANDNALRLAAAASVGLVLSTFSTEASASPVPRQPYAIRAVPDTELIMLGGTGVGAEVQFAGQRQRIIGVAQN